MKKCLVCKLVVLLAGVGALNWLTVTWLNLNLVTKFLGEATTASKAVYTLVGVAGAIALLSLIKACPCCNKSSCSSK